MKINYLKGGANAKKETIEQVRTAILWEKCDMLLTINREGQYNQLSILRSEKATELEKATATEKLEKLQAEATAIEEEQAEYAEAYNVVIENVTTAESEYGTNSVESIRSIFRLSVCDENSKFFKLAIVNNDNDIFEQFYDTMVSLHDMNNDEVDATGLRVYSKTAKESAKELADKIQMLVKQLLSISIVNDYTEKVNIKFNKTDLNCAHETFVKNLSVKIANNKDKSVQGKEFKYAIEKITNADGTVEYKDAHFMETLAKLAFVKLFKHSKMKKSQQEIDELQSLIDNLIATTYNNKIENNMSQNELQKIQPNEKLLSDALEEDKEQLNRTTNEEICQKALSMNLENSYRIKLTKTTNTTPIITKFCNDEKYDF